MKKIVRNLIYQVLIVTLIAILIFILFNIKNMNLVIIANTIAINIIVIIYHLDPLLNKIFDK